MQKIKRLIEQIACEEHGVFGKHCSHGLKPGPIIRCPKRCPGGSSREVTVDYELMVCVTHWRIYEARMEDASFGFPACPVEEGDAHLVAPFFGGDV